MNLHGHSHPAILERISRTMADLQQVMFAGFTHPDAVCLAERILGLFGGRYSKAFFSDNGSTSVEVALKMCFQYWSNQGSERKKIVAFKNSYHGDTFGAMSIAERSVFSRPFWPFLFEVEFVAPENPEELVEVLSRYPEEVAGLIYEPLVQGAGGMRFHGPELLDQSLALAKKAGILLIADEVMTGFGRTGELFASFHLEHQPDIVCLSKGLTGGVLPLGLTLSTEAIYRAFQDEDRNKTLFHGHSFTGNALSCSAALASLELLLREDCKEKIRWLERMHRDFSSHLRTLVAPIRDVRSLGTILAVDFETERSGYLSDLGLAMQKFFMDRGILLRPLGNTLYVLPPYSFGAAEVDRTYSSIETFIRSQF